MSGKSRKILPADVDKNEVPAVYRKVAPSYDFWGRITESKAHERGFELASIRNGESVLDVPVGTGLVFEKILKLNPDGRNEGIDITPEMLSRAEATPTLWISPPTLSMC